MPTQITGSSGVAVTAQLRSEAPWKLYGHHHSSGQLDMFHKTPPYFAYFRLLRICQATVAEDN